MIVIYHHKWSMIGSIRSSWCLSCPAPWYGNRCLSHVRELLGGRRFWSKLYLSYNVMRKQMGKLRIILRIFWRCSSPNMLNFTRSRVSSRTWDYRFRVTRRRPTSTLWSSVMLTPCHHHRPSHLQVWRHRQEDDWEVCEGGRSCSCDIWGLHPVWAS